MNMFRLVRISSLMVDWLKRQWMVMMRSKLLMLKDDVLVSINQSWSWQKVSSSAKGTKFMESCWDHPRWKLLQQEFQIVEGHIAEDIGQDWNQPSGEVARVLPKIWNSPLLLKSKANKSSFDARFIMLDQTIGKTCVIIIMNKMLAAISTNKIEGSDNCDEWTAASVALFPRIDQWEGCVSAGSAIVVLCRPIRFAEIISDDNSSK